MKNKAGKLLLIVFICVGIVAVALIAFGNVAKTRSDARCDTRQDKFQSDLAAIGDDYLKYGAGDKAQNALATFLNDIPADLRAGNNVVIVDRSGKIRLKANSQFLHTESDQLTMAWEVYGVIFDPDGIHQYWIQSDGESIAESDSGLIRTVGFERMGMSQPELRKMIFDYWKNVNVAESEAEFTYIGDQKNPMYLIWFMNLGTEDKVYKFLGLNAGNAFLPYADAGYLLLLIYWLLAPVWVFLDARRRQAQPLPWALLVLLTNLVGLAVYWIVQAQNAKTASARACPACGKTVNTLYAYCPWCGASFARGCPDCGKPLDRNWVACPWCGKRVE